MDENRLEKKYGLVTAITMVIGIVIGSGIFFKAPAILNASGTLSTGILAWIIGGAIMICCAVTFSILATKYEKVNGIVDYAEASLGSGYGYAIGWFISVIYTPAITGTLGYATSVYFCMLVGWIDNVYAVSLVALFFMVFIFVLNSVAPRIAGKLQVSATVIKLIPLVAMGIGGSIYGVSSGNLAVNFASSIPSQITGNPLFYGVVATAFAYEGWIIATSINSELKDAKRDLPRALVLGGIVIVAVYLVYFIGISGGVELSALSDKSGVSTAYTNVFGTVAGTILTAFITISCLGTLNGLAMGCCRNFYSLALRGEGPAPQLFSKINKKTGMPTASCVIGFIFAFLVAAYFLPMDYYGLYGGCGGFLFDISELPIVTLYAMYIPIFIKMIVSENELSVVKRVIWPLLGVCGCVFMIIAAVDKFKSSGLFQYLLFFAAVMVIGFLLRGGGKRRRQ